MKKPQKNPKRVAAGRKGGKKRHAPNRTLIQAGLRKAVISMRLKGQTFEVIARKLRISETVAWELHDEALQAINGATDRMAVRLRNRQLHRLEQVEVRLLGLLLNKKLKVRETKADGTVLEMADFESLNKLNASLVKNYEQQAKLSGAYTPAQVEVSGTKEISLQELHERLKE